MKILTQKAVKNGCIDILVAIKAELTMVSGLFLRGIGAEVKRFAVIVYILRVYADVLHCMLTISVFPLEFL